MRRLSIRSEGKLTDLSSRFLPMWRLQAPAAGSESQMLAWATAAQIGGLEYAAPVYPIGGKADRPQQPVSADVAAPGTRRRLRVADAGVGHRGPDRRARVCGACLSDRRES